MINKITNQNDFSSSPFIPIWEIAEACDLAWLHSRAEARPWQDQDELIKWEGHRVINQVKNSVIV